MSIRKLLAGLKVTCLLKEDFNVTVCDGDCGSRLVATIDFDYMRMVSPGTCSCCEGDGEVTTVIVKCFDARKDAYLGEHSITYMEYNRCFCTKCGRELIYHNDDGGDKDGSGGDDDDDDNEYDDDGSDDDADNIKNNNNNN